MISLSINGKPQQVDAPADMPLLLALRDILELRGTKYGCGIAQCGACTVHIDGQPTRSCQVTIGDIAPGARVTTIEGVEGRVAQAIKAAWQSLDVVQCGYCQSGQIMSAAALLSANPKPTDADIDSAMDGNICRCATYQRIRAAIHQAATSLG